MRSVTAPFSMAVAYAFGDDGDATVARIRASGDPGGLYRLAGPALSAMVSLGA